MKHDEPPGGDSDTTTTKPKKPAQVLQCEFCAFKTSWKVNLKRHLNSVHFANVFNCDICDYKTTRKSTLNSHKKTAHEGCLYQCSVCDFTTGWKQTLKRHQASKHEMKRFNCDYCTFSATRREHLKNHEVTSHLGESFKCHLCSFSAKWKTNLKRHIESSHSGIEYSCTQCAFKTTHRLHLKCHMSRKHAEGKDVKCSFCSYKTTTKDALNKHMKKIHCTVSEPRDPSQEIQFILPEPHPALENSEVDTDLDSNLPQFIQLKEYPVFVLGPPCGEVSIVGSSPPAFLLGSQPEAPFLAAPETFTVSEDIVYEGNVIKLVFNREQNLCEFVTGEVEEVEHSLERAPVKVEELYPQIVSVHTETENIKETHPLNSQHQSIQYTVGV